MREPQQHFIQCNGVKLSVYEWKGGGDPYLLVHATGFHARCWDQVVRQLGDRHIFSVDLRCHGDSQKTEPPYNWDYLSQDLVQLVEQLDLRNLTLTGHSMGGYMSTVAAFDLASRIKQLILLDPVILDPADDRAIARADAEALPQISKRRADWGSAEEMFDTFSNKNPYARWDKAVLRDYCRFGLHQRTDGPGFTLACPAHMEAAFYIANRSRLQSIIGTLELPVRLIRARSRRENECLFTFDASPTWARLGEILPNVEAMQLTGFSHFFPMEIPHQVARWILTRER